ncbi:helix-hairpin-helix domain-containing protein [Streptomyces abyssomicinicus]|uniref:helix-hairpin-helix domain-containing protein n=1 Tax=Streptomyces abyssomicinicus TaxID=574929 RepID=UPI003F75BD37
MPLLTGDSGGPRGEPGGAPGTVPTAQGRAAALPGGSGRGRHRRPSDAADATRDRAAALFATPPRGVPPSPSPPVEVREDTAAPSGPARGGDGWAEALRDRLPPWLQAACALHRRGVVALAALLALAVALALQHHLAARPTPVAAPKNVQGAVPSPFRPRPAGAGHTTAAPPIVVDVGGKVRDPGVHALPPGSRVADALRAAGGVRPGADTAGLNRARFLVDGEQLLVGVDPPPGAPPPPAAPGGAAGAAGSAPGPAAPVALNTATVEQLDTLPGVGPVLAQHIVDHRTRTGGFRTVEELREVNGIGDRRFADLRDLVRP